MGDDVAKKKKKVNSTLIDNWVEERQCSQFDKDNRKEDGTLNKDLMRSGHKALLAPDSTCSYQTTTQTSFQHPIIDDGSCQIGQRQKLITNDLYKAVNEQIYSEQSMRQPQLDFSSTTYHDYHKDVVKNKMQLVHPLSDSPVSYWNQNTSKITGTTPMAHVKAPFHRNAAFSCPIEESLD